MPAERSNDLTWTKLVRFLLTFTLNPCCTIHTVCTRASNQPALGPAWKCFWNKHFIFRSSREKKWYEWWKTEKQTGYQLTDGPGGSLISQGSQTDRRGVQNLMRESYIVVMIISDSCRESHLSSRWVSGQSVSTVQSSLVRPCQTDDEGGKVLHKE